MSGRLRLASCCIVLLCASEAAAQSPRSAWSLSLEGVLAAPGEELDPFVEGVGLGARAAVGHDLSTRWRLVLGGGLASFDPATSLDPGWTVLEAQAELGFDLLGPPSRADLLVTLGGGVVSFDPDDRADPGPPPALETVVVPSIVAGLRLELPLSGPVGVAIAPRAVRTIPVADDKTGPDSSWLWEIGAGVVLRP